MTDSDDLPPSYDEITGAAKPDRSHRDAKTKYAVDRSVSPLAGQANQFHPLVSQPFPRVEPAPAPSAPLFVSTLGSGIESLDNVARQLPRSIIFEFGLGPALREQFQFYLRDKFDNNLFTKVIVRQSESTLIALQTTDGQVFIQISSDGSGPGSSTFLVTHRNTQLGSLDMRMHQPNTIRIYKSYEHRSYDVKFVTPIDIAISRMYDSTSICKIHFPKPPTNPPNSSDLFNGTLTFGASDVTVVEQCLGLAWAVLYLVSRHNILGSLPASEDTFSTQDRSGHDIPCTGFLFCVIGVLIVIIIASFVVAKAGE